MSLRLTAPTCHIIACDNKSHPMLDSTTLLMRTRLTLADNVTLFGLSRSDFSDITLVYSFIVDHATVVPGMDVSFCYQMTSLV